jgi:hypothetical protein
VTIKLFFKKIAGLIKFACKANPKYSMEFFDWDWYSFWDNILVPNKSHVQSVMGLSDDITDQVVYLIDYILNDWNGDDHDENNEFDLSHDNFCTVEGIDF